MMIMCFKKQRNECTRAMVPRGSGEMGNFTMDGRRS
jgi:hypothetical protein